MTGKRYYMTTLADWQRHAARFANSHFIVLDSRPARASVGAQHAAPGAASPERNNMQGAPGVVAPASPPAGLRDTIADENCRQDAGATTAAEVPEQRQASAPGATPLESAIVQDALVESTVAEAGAGQESSPEAGTELSKNCQASAPGVRPDSLADCAPTTETSSPDAATRTCPEAVEDSRRILVLIEADEGVHLSLEDEPAFEALPHPLAQKPISDAAQAALAPHGVAPGATTFDAAEALARVHPLLRHRVF